MTTVTVEHMSGYFRVKHNEIIHFVTTEIGAAQVVADRIAGLLSKFDYVTHTFNQGTI